jgi:hypothetical protein
MERAFPRLEPALVRPRQLGGQPAHRVIDKGRTGNSSMSLFFPLAQQGPEPHVEEVTSRESGVWPLLRLVGAGSIMGGYENTSGRAESCAAEPDKMAKRDQK